MAKKLSKLIAEAVAEVNARRYSGAEKIYRKVLKQDPWHLDGHYLLGSLLAERGDLKAAERHLGIAAELKPDSPYIWNNLGNLRKIAGDANGALDAWNRALALKADLAEAWVNVGQIYVDQHSWQEAEDCMRRAVALKDLAPAWNALATLAERRGDSSEAIRCCHRALEIRPGDGAARFALARLEGTPLESTPRDVVRALFDDYASRFESHLTEDLAYSAPAEIVRLIASHAGEARFARAVDLGCGTGLMGAHLGAQVGELVGVDLSPRMIAQAKGKNAYQRLVVSDLIDFLDAEMESFDLLLAADVLIYLGELRELFAAAFARAGQGALFAFSVESTQAAGWELKMNGRYAHSRDYVRDRAEAAGWQVLACEDIVVRRESGTPVAGDIFLLARQGRVDGGGD